jgi:glycosyltransferase involved in cell wall biosynthesis
MKIAIDVSQIIYGTGVSHYRENLVKNLLKIDFKNEYVVFGGSLRRYFELKESMSRLGTGFRTKPLVVPPTLAHILWNKLHMLNLETLIGGVDVVHTSDWAEPPSNAYKVTTVHDLVPVKYPDLTPAIIVKTHRERMKWVKKESQIIIVPSKSTMNDLLSEGFKSERIRVIYEAPNMELATDSDILATKNKFGINGEYLIFPGTHPRKNLERGIEAFRLVNKAKLTLVVVGDKSFVSKKSQKNVKFVGNVSDLALSALISGARLMLFPSLYEGLGIPVLDAFACKIPVVTSDVSAMPEVAGDAGVLVKPNDIGSIAEGINEALLNPEKYIKRGVERVKKYTWEKTARETLDVYQTALN